MLDLEKLEAQLDEALEKETKESLLEWLNNKRKNSLGEYFGEGDFEDFKEYTVEFDYCFNEPRINYRSIKSSSVAHFTEPDYSLAA